MGPAPPQTSEPGSLQLTFLRVLRRHGPRVPQSAQGLVSLPPLHRTSALDPTVLGGDASSHRLNIFSDRKGITAEKDVCFK